jgi:hypothetical protein
LVNITADLFDDGLADWALERREIENGVLIVREQELHEATAKTADAVVENEVSPFPVRWRLCS